jgi:hypothetical protein
MLGAMFVPVTVLEVATMVASAGQICDCSCDRRHPGQTVCTEHADAEAVLVHLDNPLRTSGLALCRPCAQAWPELVGRI